jgi:hypothetical protein
MSIKKITSITLLTLTSLGIYAQDAGLLDEAPSKLPSVALGAGILYFNGDIGKGVGVTPYSTVRGGYCLTVEERPLPYLGFSLTGVYGQLAASERSLDTTKNLNFQSTIITGDLLVNLHLDGLLLKSSSAVAPFFYAGVSFMSFSPYTDVKDANGNPYHYWTDGTIRNQPQTASDIVTAKIIQRDYTYETPLDSGKYSKTAISIPVGAGIKMRVNENFSFNLQATYYFTFSPYIDNYKISGMNDKYLYSFISLEYHFGKKKEGMDDSRYQGVDFSALIKDTVKTVQQPKEKEQPISDSAIAAQNAAFSSAVDHGAEFNENPTLKSLQKVDASHTSKEGAQVSKTNLPAKFKAADKNGDGYISSEEITQTIDEFFDGTSTYTIADINALIDYFFDQ